MFNRMIACSVTAALLLGGCAIHPLPEDFAGLDTNAIVLHIRCEAREAIKDATIAFLLNPDIEIPEPTRQAARALKQGDVRFENFNIKRLDPFSQHYLLKYERSAIAYDFTFDISEGNTAGASVDFARTLTNGTFGLAGGINTDRQRQTIRNFRVSDTFAQLRTLTVCGAKSAPNYIYPITGSVGLNEVVKTFVDLNEFNRLSPGEKGTVPVLADTFKFQTNVSGSVAPSIALSPVRSGLSLTSASADLGASRKDTHQIVVAFSLPVTDEQIRREQRAVGLLAVSPISAIGGKTPAERRALIEIDNQKVINSLNNFVVQTRQSR